jgi:hypothetical protein
MIQQYKVMITYHTITPCEAVRLGGRPGVQGPGRGEPARRAGGADQPARGASDGDLH